MAQFNSQETAALDAKIADGIDEDELADLEALKELKVDKGRAVSRVLQHAGVGEVLDLENELTTERFQIAALTFAADSKRA